MARPGVYMAELLDAGHDELESYISTVNRYSEPLSAAWASWT